MRSLGKFIGLVAAGLLLAGCGGTAAGLNSSSAASPATAGAAPAAKVGAPLPAFTVTGLNGEAVRSADLGGKPLVLNFWASWCSACVQELPSFQSTAQQLPPDQVKFLFVNFQDTPDAVKSFVSRIGFDQPVALDRQGDVAMKLNVLGLPTTFFVDSSGMLRYVVNGEISPEQLRYNLQALVPGLAIASPQASAAPSEAPKPTVPSALPADAPQSASPAQSAAGAVNQPLASAQPAPPGAVQPPASVQPAPARPATVQAPSTTTSSTAAKTTSAAATSPAPATSQTKPQQQQGTQPVIGCGCGL